MLVRQQSRGWGSATQDRVQDNVQEQTLKQSVLKGEGAMNRGERTCPLPQDTGEYIYDEDNSGKELPKGENNGK